MLGGGAEGLGGDGKREREREGEVKRRPDKIVIG